MFRLSRPLTNEEWNRVRAAIWDVKQFLQNGLGLRNTFGDRVIVSDEIRIYEGEGKNRKLKVNRATAISGWELAEAQLQAPQLVLALPSQQHQTVKLEQRLRLKADNTGFRGQQHGILEH